MDRDTFIITVYCLVEEHYRQLTAAGRVPIFRSSCQQSKV
jgi:hypothetical protein